MESSWPMTVSDIIIANHMADVAGPLLRPSCFDDLMLTSLIAFGGSWADEVEETVGTQALPVVERRGGGGGNSFYNNSGPRTDDRGKSHPRHDDP